MAGVVGIIFGSSAKINVSGPDPDIRRAIVLNPLVMEKLASRITLAHGPGHPAGGA